MEHEPDRGVARSATRYLRRAAAAAIVLALFCVPAAARAVQPLVVHHVTAQLPGTPKACTTVRVAVRAPAQTTSAAPVRPVTEPAAPVRADDQSVRVEPRPSDGQGLRAPPRGSVL